MKTCLLFSLLFFFSLSGLSLASEETGCVSGECHGSFMDGKVHPKNSGCEKCHQPTGEKHPGQDKGAFSLTDPACYECHEFPDQLQIHPPVAADDCVVCHNPHGNSDNKWLLQTGIKLCLSCHQGIVQPEMTYLHEPIEKGTCLTCHDPHGSDHEKLLVKNYSLKLFESYTDNKYELCFSCHNSNLLRFPDTSFSTNFRDGKRNLHYLHVNRKSRGKNCRLCHVVHGASLPHLMADKVTFGEWQLPLNFEKTDTGGSCTPGCHRQERYDRKK